MSAIVNLTNTQAAPLVSMSADGQWQVTVVVKATFDWDRAGKVGSIEPQPIVPMDQWAGEPGSSGLLRASDLGPTKARADVLLCGALAFARPIKQTDVLLVVGTHVQKGARVYGERVWLPSTVADVVPSQPRPVTRVPIAWERSWGGGDPQDPKAIEPRNPAGSGVCREPKLLHGQPAPSFEDPDKPIGALVGKPAPIGFGPIAQHWPARLTLAGTYDETWEKSRRPLPPADFSPRFFNVASADQQLDSYQPGEEVRLINMTSAGQDCFRLPDLAVPVSVVTAEELSEAVTAVDTIIIEPEERRFSLLGKVTAPLPSGPQSLGRIIVGEMLPGMRKAIEQGKKYLWPARPRRAPV